MRWVTYRRGPDSVERAGVVVGSDVHGLPDGLSLHDVLRSGSLSETGERATREPDEIVPLEGLELLPPIPRPPSIRDFMSFEAHLTNARLHTGRSIEPAWYEHPCFYFSNPAAVQGPNAQVAISPGSAAFDFELEIAAVVGREGIDVLPSEALPHIAGFMIMCDWSARDLQRAESTVGLGPAKGKDGATSFGPWMVTPDELVGSRRERGYDLAMDVSINGRRVGGGNWTDIHWSFEQMLAYASRGTRIVPGDVLGSGTVGTGCLVELRNLLGADKAPWLAPGDEVVLSISGLGALRSTIIAYPPVPDLPELLSS